MRPRLLAAMVAALVLVPAAPAFAGPREEVAIRVELYGDGNIHASSSVVNTGDVNGTAYVQTPEAGQLTRPGRPCLWLSVAYHSIRWDDGTLTSGRVLVALATGSTRSTCSPRPRT